MSNLCMALLIALLLSGCWLEEVVESTDDCCCIKDNGDMYWSSGGSCRTNESSWCRKDGATPQQCGASAMSPITDTVAVKGIDLSRGIQVALASGVALHLEDEVSTLENAPDQVSLAQCISDCVEKKTGRPPYCAAARIQLPGSHARGLRTVRSEIEKGGSTFTLESDQLLNSFGYKQDPCKRSGLIVNSNIIRNTGDECAADITCEQWDETRGVCTSRQSSADAVRLLIPAEIEGALTVADGLQTVTFDDPRKSPSIELEGRDMTEEWGGSIRSIRTDNQSILIQMPRSCVFINY